VKQFKALKLNKIQTQSIHLILKSIEKLKMRLKRNSTPIKALQIIVLFVLIKSTSIFGQTDTIKVNNTLFLIQSKVIPNEWGTSDSINLLYRLNDKKKYVLSYYTYKDQGGDCNNLFWNTETMTIQENSLTFNTHYFQKTGLDPIPEFRKQIYIVDSLGKLTLTYNKYKYYEQTKWVTK